MRNTLLLCPPKTPNGALKSFRNRYVAQTFKAPLGVWGERSFILFVFLIIYNQTFAQHKKEAEKLVNQGIESQSKGDFKIAIIKYDRALQLDSNNVFALTEKAFSLYTINDYPASIECCKKALSQKGNDKVLATAYVTYGNDLDALNKSDEALDIYNKGISLFPKNFDLPFNKGIALTHLKKFNESLKSMEDAFKLNPDDPGVNHAIGILLYEGNKRIPSLFALSMYLSLQPEGGWAKDDLERIKKIMSGKNHVTSIDSLVVNINENMCNDTALKQKENTFSTAELILSENEGNEVSVNNVNNTEVQQFSKKLKTLCGSLQKTSKANCGFYWEFYAQFFIEMKKMGYLDIFSHIIFTSSDDADVMKWLDNHSSDVDSFNAWCKSYNWIIDKK